MSSQSIAQETLAGVLWPAGRGARFRQRALRQVALAVLGSAFVALAAQVQVPLWPVPITGQTFAVLMVGMVFGLRLGAATLLLYMAEGALGLPVFAKLAAGPGVILGPTGGYIVGFVLAAGIVGYLAERGWGRNAATTALAMLIGNVAIYLPGLPWLAVFYAGPGAAYVAQTGAETAFGAAIQAGALPFLLGDALKLALAAALVPLAWRLLGARTR
ncbi:MAG: biotin transporter BioY [Kiloniellaceae bacterium]